MQRNPYLGALVSITIGLVAAGAICALVGSTQVNGPESYMSENPGVAAFAAAGVWLNAALLSLLVTLVAGAVTWKAQPRSD
jgi:uncharacterized membrane protein